MFLSQIFVCLLLSVTIAGTLFEPFIGVVAYYLLDIIRPQNLFWWALGAARLSFWIAVVTIISWFFHLLKDRKRNGIWTTQNKLMVCFWIMIVLSHIFSSYKDVSWISFIRISKMILIYFIAVNLINNQKRIRSLVWSLVLSVGYLAIRGNWQYFVLGYHQITRSSFGGYNVSLDNNGYAMLFVMVLPFVYFLFFTEKRIWLKLFLIGLAPVLIHAIILTYSRGGFLGMGAVCALSLLRTKKKAIKGIAGILFIVVIARLAGPPVIDRLRTVSDYEQDSAAMGRIEAWKAGLRMMADRPFVGVGLDNYRYFAMEYNPEIQGEIVAHNAFIHTGGEAGIPAMILYILILFFCFRDLGIIRKRFYLDKDGWKYYYSSMLEASLWGYTICGLFLTLAWFEMFYPLLALVVSLKLIAGEEKPAKKPGATVFVRGQEVSSYGKVDIGG